MKKFTLFLIHGIGIHRSAGWAEATIDLMQTAWARSVNLSGPMLDYVTIVPITYDEVFESYLNDFSDVSSAVLSDALELSSEQRASINKSIDELKSSPEANDKHFIFSYIFDVLLYKMALVKEQVNVVVAKQLYEHISALGTQDSFGIVAHSLGTRVINDTLQNIRSGNANEANFYKQGYRLKFLMQISDVTDLFGLPFKQDKYPPKDVYSYDTYDYLRTVTNRFDPIARIIPTRLDHWPKGRLNEEYLGRPAYKDILLDHVHEVNVHGLTHYMLHPEITDEIFELCGFGRRLIDRNSRRASFPPLGPSVNPSLKVALENLMLDTFGLANDTWQTYINLVIKHGEFEGHYSHDGEHNGEHNGKHDHIA
ncbi:hypothetical protein NBRC116583_33500 [Arenicella sp. 4NH20-0111]|uniref:hypothetical protein n=1 Tax=Arenicella sp. 4NH20-0111 TaxID=3127648 RepID=UPI003105BE8E